MFWTNRKNDELQSRLVGELSAWGERLVGDLAKEVVTLNGKLAAQKAEFHERIEKLFNWAVEYGERVRNLEAAEDHSLKTEAKFDQIADLIANLSLRVSNLEHDLKLLGGFDALYVTNPAPRKKAKATSGRRRKA